jgi:hypothetical protein
MTANDSVENKNPKMGCILKNITILRIKILIIAKNRIYIITG